MNSKVLMITGGVVLGVGVSLGIAKMIWDRKGSASDTEQQKSDSPYAEMIQETLQTHKGEENPFVQAFEQALEQEEAYEKELGDQVGLRSPA